jgi:electron transfer flavoprotein alpha subunit
MSILVICEHEGGSFKKTASELLGKARELASQLGTTVAAVVLGDAHRRPSSARSARATVYQVSRRLRRLRPLRGHRRPSRRPPRRPPTGRICSPPRAYLGKDAHPAPRRSPRHRARAPSAPTLRVAGRRPSSAAGPCYAGKLLGDVTHRSARPALFTVRPNSVPASRSPPPAATSVVTAGVGRRRHPAHGGRAQGAGRPQVVDLTEAERIVSGGRSLKSKPRTSTR